MTVEEAIKILLMKASNMKYMKIIQAEVCLAGLVLVS